MSQEPVQLQLPKDAGEDAARERAQALEAMRDVYRWSIADGMPSVIEGLPARERFNAEKYVNMYGDLAKSVVDIGLGQVESVFKSLLHLHKKLDLYDQFYGPRGLPTVANRWRRDDEFGRQRLAGVNPVLIQSCRAIPDHFPVEDSQLIGLLPDSATLQSELEGGRLFLLDYAVAEGVSTAKGRFLAAPICLLHLNERKQLLPLAVQLGQTPDTGPIFTPHDNEWVWLLAKMFVQSADAAFHEGASHLLRTHLVCETFYVSLMRQVHESHPIHQFLAPHFRFTIAINYAARNQLLVPGGAIDHTMSAAYAGTVELVQRAYRAWSFDQFDLRTDLRARGVDDVDVLPGYHYRDDALLVWDAIAEHAEGIVARYYASDEDVAADPELQAWARELVDPEAGRVKGLPGDGAFRTKADLVQVLTQVVFTCTAEHSSVNNGQYDYFSFTPNCPGAIYVPPPTTKNALTEHDVVKALPSPVIVTQQVAMVHMLSQPTEAPLTDTPDGAFADDPDAAAVFARFRDRMCAISKTIEERNAGLEVPYPYMDPAQIAQSIAI